MARKPTQPSAPTELPHILPAVVQDIETAQDQALSTTETDEVFAAGVDIGRLEAMDFVATVANSALVAIYENVKKSKAWRLLRDPRSSNGSNFLSLNEFCQVKLGRTYGRLQHLVANRNLLGQEAFEQAERIGLRQVDYNAVKALPAPDQELVRRAVEEATSRDEVLDLLQELAARHGQEKQALAKRVDELQADALAKDERISVKQKQIDRLEESLLRIKRLPPERQVDALKGEATAIADDARQRVQVDLRAALVALERDAGNDRLFMAALLGPLAAELAALREEFNLADLSAAESTFDEGAREALRAGLAEVRSAGGAA